MPAEAVSVEPTLAVPVIFGTAVLAICTSLKWTKPLGQPLVALVTRAQEKSPCQLSIDTMISSAETTLSTYATCPAEPAG